MISLSYVNGNQQNPLLFDAYTNLLLEFDKMMDEVSEARYTYEAAYADFLLNNEFLEADDDEVKAKNGEVQEKKRNLIEKIGATIIALFKKASEFISNIVETIKNSSFKDESDLNKLAALQKKYPDLSNDIKIAFEKGDLNLKDAKSLAELEKDYSEIMSMSKNANITPGSMEDKWNKAKDKFNNAGDTVIKVGAVVGAITTIAGVSAVMAKNKNTIAQAKKNTSDDKANAFVRASHASGGNKINYDDGFYTTQLKITREYIGINSSQARLAGGVSQKIHNFIAGTLDNIDRKISGSNYNTDLQDYKKNLRDRASIQYDSSTSSFVDKHDNAINKLKDENKKLKKENKILKGKNKP